MSCPICHRSSCTLSFHSLEEQDRYEARQAMSDDVQILREQLQDAEDEVADLVRELDRAQNEVADLQGQLEGS